MSPEHQAALTAAREEGLARRFVNLPELRFKAARSASQALLPAHLEAFFTRSLERNRGRWERRADGKIRCERVPVNLRREQEIAFRRRHGTVERAYLSLTFDKTTVGEDGRTDLEHLVPGCVDAVASGRLKDLGLKECWLERSFRVVISRHADRLLDLDAKAGAGQDMALAIGREQRLMEDAKRRRQERLAEVRLEQQLVPRAPEFLGVVTVLPAAARVGEAKADDALLGRVREVEAAQGRALTDRRDDGLGFDAIAGDADGQAVRFILARRLDADGRLWLKASECAQVRHLGAQALIYAAHDGEILARSTAARPSTWPSRWAASSTNSSPTGACSTRRATR